MIITIFKKQFKAFGYLVVSSEINYNWCNIEQRKRWSIMKKKTCSLRRFCLLFQRWPLFKMNQASQLATRKFDFLLLRDGNGCEYLSLLIGAWETKKWGEGTGVNPDISRHSRLGSGYNIKIINKISRVKLMGLRHILCRNIRFCQKTWSRRNLITI